MISLGGGEEMSVFEAIKDRFQTVQQDLSVGIGLIKGHDAVVSPVKVVNTDNVNYNAGADLLFKYQKVWKDVQTVNEENAKKAEAADREIQILYGDIKKNCNNLTGFYREVKSLPSFLSVLQNLTDLLACLEESCDTVEAALVQLEDLSEQLELKQHKTAHIEQLEDYKKRKDDDLRKMKDQMSHEHAILVEKLEKKKQEVLRERSETFEEAFQDDLIFYKTHGHMERVMGKDMAKNLNLSDITLDHDEAALAAFLASTEVTPCSERGLLGVTPSSEVAGDITSPSETDVLTPMTPGSEWTATDDLSSHSDSEDQLLPGPPKIVDTVKVTEKNTDHESLSLPSHATETEDVGVKNGPNLLTSAEKVENPKSQNAS